MKYASRIIPVAHADGLNLRAAVLLCEQARRFPCVLLVRCGAQQADAKSVWDLLGLMAEYGSELVFEARGPQSTEALNCLEILVTHQFQVAEKEDCCERV